MSTYRVILADPPWRYHNWSDAAHGAASSAMETMATPDICAIPVSRWAHPDGCILAMWATWPKLEDAFSVISAWGFDYVTGWPWVKTVPAAGEIRRGIGFWAQSCSWLESALGPHLELFARSERAGWTCYGLDLGWRLGPDGVSPVPLPPAGALFAEASP